MLRLVTLLLLVAGASCALSREAVWLAGPLVLFRLTGKLMAGWLAMRLQGLVTASQLGRFYEQAGRYERAIELYGNVAKNRGTGNDALVQKAMLRFGQLCAYRTNDFFRAEQALRVLLQTYPDSPLRAEAVEVLETIQKKPEAPQRKLDHGRLPDF